MSYKDLEIKKCYETSENRTDLLDSFYIPMLNQTVKYFRIAGFFSSSSLAIASKGVEGLINNGGVMKLLISPEISNEDFEILKSHGNNELNELSPIFKDFDIHDFDSDDHLKALAWMLANGKLEIKIVIGKNSENSLFHQKIGVGFDSDGNMLSFSGSINETAKAWLDNIEEFKTFKSWEPEQAEYLLGDLKKFNSYWNNEKKAVSMVFDLPSSIREEIISVKPRDVYDLALMKKYSKTKETSRYDISLFTHQREAVKKWIAYDKKMLFEMATGTGKTRTAIGCSCVLLKVKEHMLVIVATPQNTLSRQWKAEVDDLNVVFDKYKIIDGSNAKWKSDLEILLLDLASNELNNAIVYTTHDTASSDKFIEIIKNNKRNFTILFICDEVHAIGSAHKKHALLDLYDYRIGLSATPERMFDEQGTKFIRDYFGDCSYEFTIHDALTTINPITKKPFLNEFYYYPCFVPLTDEEQSKYNSYSKKIAYIMNQDDPDLDILNTLRTKRAEVLKNAELKFDELKKTISSLSSKGRVRDTIIFATDKQIDGTLEYLNSINITRSKITEEESASKKMGINGLTERQEIINQFKQGKIQVLVGIKCLDEGIDIKNARIAVLMASSTNPREYVQRVGRVIRPDNNKQNSIIFDFIVRPDDESYISILEKEGRRAMLIAQNAINYEEVKRMFEDSGVNIDANK
ncbi:MAG: DEAD/DEAH box helicase family protein [Candidatus Nanoarchaeia archaeon]|nr:DEAD/DEAH box helicase family protein [Candidatus Nanoarchaeia archaeon]